MFYILSNDACVGLISLNNQSDIDRSSKVSGEGASSIKVIVGVGVWPRRIDWIQLEIRRTADHCARGCNKLKLYCTASFDRSLESKGLIVVLASCCSAWTSVELFA